MARIRTVKPEFWASEQVMECSPIARLLFIGLWNFCDDAGNHPLSEKTLRDYVRKECFFHSEDRVYFPSAGRFRGFILRPEKMKTEFEDFCEAVVHVDVPPEY